MFSPRREHARFCSARCRVAWNRQNTADPADPLSALNWAITAMRDTIGRLPGLVPRDRARAVAEIGEAVWRVTIVDATLMRHHPMAYDAVIAARSPADRQRIEETLAGLRYVRNQISVRNQVSQDADHADFVGPDPGQPGADRVTAWTWKPVPEPPLSSLQPRAQQWEMTRYRSYQDWLADRSVGEVFDLAAAFLELVAVAAPSGARQGLTAPVADASAGDMR